jgi:ribosomal protein S1
MSTDLKTDVGTEEKKEPEKTENRYEEIEKALKRTAKAVAISSDGKPEVRDIDAIRADTFTKLYSAMSSGTILTGTLSGCETAKNVITPELAVQGIVDYGGVKIIIPAKEMWTKIPEGLSEDASSKDKFKFYTSKVSAMLNAQIDFLVERVDKDKNIACASRASAMAIRRKQNYIRKMHGETESRMEKAVREKRRIEARVVSTSGTSVRIEIFGVETRVKAADACWRYVSKLSSVFHPGQHIYVIVKDMRIDKNTGDIAINASIKEATENMLLHNIKYYQEGSIQTGTISGKTVKGYYVAVGNTFTGIDVFCRRVMGQSMPQTGDIVACKINRIYDDGNASGKITRIIKPIQSISY